MWARLEALEQAVPLLAVSSNHVQIQNWTCFNLFFHGFSSSRQHLAGHCTTLGRCYHLAQAASRAIHSLAWCKRTMWTLLWSKARSYHLAAFHSCHPVCDTSLNLVYMELFQPLGAFYFHGPVGGACQGCPLHVLQRLYRPWPYLDQQI